jgi:16S rRNA (cytidine1402-2'-O)-methyltransferase
MGTLYVTSVPAGDPDDTTFRAYRAARQASLVLADDLDGARRWLDRGGLSKPLAHASQGNGFLASLGDGDVLLLLEGGPSPSTPARMLIASARAGGHAVVPVPAPSLPVTALVVSGLPSDSFVYLGGLPEATAARRELLAAVAAERRSLVATAESGALLDLMLTLLDSWGDRPAVLVAAWDQRTEVVWRGTLAGAREAPPYPFLPGQYLLVVGGAREQPARWDGGRLQAEVLTCLAQGLEAKEIGRELALRSGWPRREIYRLAVEAARNRSH